MLTSTDIPADIMHKLSAQITARLGLHYPPERWGDLLRGVRAMQADLETRAGARSGEDLIHRLACSPWRTDDAENLGHHLTVGETYFWREPQALAAMQKHILPPLIEERRDRDRRLRIWSAGCCTGEEPYSIAMLLHQLLPDIARWDVRIQATDLNSWFLNKAATGRYRSWSFRGTPQWVKDGYFRPAETDTLEVLPQVKKLVHFARLNLATDEYPAAENHTQNQDVILCRNVLIYMEPSQAQAILHKFLLSLNEGGWLVLSATETWLSQSPCLRPVTFEGAILFRKQTRPAVNAASSTRRSTISARPVSRLTDTAPPRLAVTAKKPSPSATIRPTISDKSATNATSVYVEAQRLYRQGTYDKVIAHLTQATTELATPQVLLLLAKAYANSGQPILAIATCDRALALDKLCTPAYYLRATIFQEQGRLEEATQSLSQALFLEADFIMAHFALGNIAAQQGRKVQAIRHWNNTLSLLQKCESEATLQESDDMTAGHLTEMVASMLEAAK